MFEHSTHFGAEYLYGNVVKVEDGEEYKTIICEDGTEYKAKAVIVATGTKRAYDEYSWRRRECWTRCFLLCSM